MGTRADFYIGTGPNAEWLGSIAWDGYRIADAKEKPQGPGADADAVACWKARTARTEQQFREAVADLLAVNSDGTSPDHGWPWPWNDSSITDYAYAFKRGRCCTYTKPPHDGWPDMSSRKAVTLGARSGLIVFGAP